MFKNLLYISIMPEHVVVYHRRNKAGAIERREFVRSKYTDRLINRIGCVTVFEVIVNGSCTLLWPAYVSRIPQLRLSEAAHDEIGA